MSKTLNATRPSAGGRLNASAPDMAASGGVDGQSALQALAKAGAAESPMGAARRGPFRPDVWLNARQRHASRLAVHYFRAIDVLAVIAVTLICGWAVSVETLLEIQLSIALPFVFGAAMVLGLMRSLSLYQFARDRRLAVHMASVVGVTAASAAAAILLGVVIRGSALEISGLLTWTLAVMATLGILHLIWSEQVRRWRASGVLTPNIVVVGATRNAERLIRDALTRRDINVLGVFDDRLARSPDSVEGVPVLGTAEALLTHRMTPYVDRIVLAIDPNAQARVRELTSRLQALPNEVTLLVDPQGEEERTAALEKLARAPLASLNGSVDADRRAFNKRIQDLIFGAIAVILMSPVILTVALLVKLDSPGPIFFRQRRHGFNQEEIVVWKFRSMRQETADATASRQVTADDDRITRLGRFLRSTSLDELPQLLNVLKGEMSLVGPRPHAIGMKTGQVESALLVAEYAHRHRIKPGMTGWAAVQGSRGPLHDAHDVRRRVQLDVDYIERQSLWLDLWIMAVTLPVLLGDRVAVR